ncbi:MAG: ABC transporter permease, partial [Chloroflexaceae bacterium]|nr:ABC transporter permease [Chloroflexaceae bacterium]
MSEANPALESKVALPSKTPLNADALVLTKPPRSLWANARRRFFKHRLAVLGMAVLMFLTLAVVFGPLIYTVDRNDIDFSVPTMAPPSLTNPMGTDDLGRDILARALFGGRLTLAVGFIAMLLAIIVGTSIGLISGFFGGIVDQAMMWITDLFLSLPQLPLFLLIYYLFRDQMASTFGSEQFGTFVLVISLIGLLNWMATARIVRASVQSL